jgi:hypothetical protein
MGSHFADMVILVNRWVKISHLGQCTPKHVRHWMEDVALGHDWTPFKEVMHFHSTLDVDLLTMDIEHMDDDC